MCSPGLALYRRVAEARRKRGVFRIVGSGRRFAEPSIAEGAETGRRPRQSRAPDSLLFLLPAQAVAKGELVPPLVREFSFGLVVSEEDVGDAFCLRFREARRPRWRRLVRSSGPGSGAVRRPGRPLPGCPRPSCCSTAAMSSGARVRSARSPCISAYGVSPITTTPTVAPVRARAVEGESHLRSGPCSLHRGQDRGAAEVMLPLLPCQSMVQPPHWLPMSSALLPATWMRGADS